MNRKGFTLTELLVVIAILGIITGMTYPLLRSLTGNLEKRKYDNYKDSMLASSKLYNDSYSEDLFGHKEYGCAYITYDQLSKRDLLKDIEVEGMSCNSPKTYIKVIKHKDKYGYAAFLSCGKKVNGQATTEEISIPDVIPDIDESSCTGVDANNLSITADLAMVDSNIVGNPFNKKRKTTKLIITSGTGIGSNIAISTVWSTSDCVASGNCNSVTGWNKATFKIIGNQEKQMLDGNSISTKSNELITPANGNGKYYLLVKVDSLQDLYGSKWVNTVNPDSKYLSFGPFSVDNEKPKIIANAYKCNNSSNTRTKTGNSLKASSQVSGSGSFNLFDLSGNYNGWLNSSNYGNGICLEYSLTDNSGVKSAFFQQNNANIKENVAGYNTLNTTGNTQNYTNGTTQTYSTYIADNGHRYARLTVKDFAGNKSYIDVEAKIDKALPNCGTIASSADGENGVTGTVACASDALSGCNSGGTYSQKKASLNVNITDKAGNIRACPVTIYSLAVVNTYCNENGGGCGSNSTKTYYKLSGKTQSVSATAKRDYAKPSNAQNITFNANHTVTFYHTYNKSYSNFGQGTIPSAYSASNNGNNTAMTIRSSAGGAQCIIIWPVGGSGVGENHQIVIGNGASISWDRFNSSMGGSDYDATYRQQYGMYFAQDLRDCGNSYSGITNPSLVIRPYIEIKYKNGNTVLSTTHVKKLGSAVTLLGAQSKTGWTFKTWQAYSQTSGSTGLSNAGYAACMPPNNVYYPAGYTINANSWNISNQSYPCPDKYGFMNNVETVYMQAVWQKNPWTVLDSTVKEGARP